MRPHINPARQESTGRGGHGNGLPLLFLGGLNRALLRSCCGAPVTADFHAGGRLLQGGSTVLHRLDQGSYLAVQHHPAMLASGWFHTCQLS